MNHGLRIESLTVRIPLLGGSVVHAASDIDLDVPAGTVTALVGESGCGKSIIATSVMNMLPPNASRTGTVTVGTPDLEIDVFSGTAFRGRHVALVPQSAATHLTPVRTARSQLQETIDALGSDHTCDALALRVGLEPSALDCYPHELSGGMAQRVAIAGALAGNPSVIVADEPTANLDRELTDHVMGLLRECADSGAAVLLITHDLASLTRSGVADRLAVMYASRIMETGPAALVFQDPLHDYTRDLLGALPSRGLTPMPGSPPQLTDLPEECVYHLRRPESKQSGGPTELVTLGDRTYRTLRKVG
ncbi:ABC transporter ATP-binding protein [Rhodococcus qingshengii]|uniref:Nickel import system ATP-binding protein NikD n=1 Tax=Rhodococcus qingshengii TaxID=334542 RepID=A0AAW6L9Z5_RHOSG|nr:MULTISPECIES: ABC transporter ATP-binding protein [Rhodococcus]MDE8643729.1 ABC transporter ATP-binding protein [Rhodococcus qingshengii]OFE06101.1 ABC transporter ATP-binding protein [Rhodococcus sp. 1139]UUE26187.1 ABC transporter ATP-binding protein [Rhodococcus qingshengii]